MKEKGEGSEVRGVSVVQDQSGSEEAHLITAHSVHGFTSARQTHYRRHVGSAAAPCGRHVGSAATVFMGSPQLDRHTIDNLVSRFLSLADTNTMILLNRIPGNDCRGTLNEIETPAL